LNAMPSDQFIEWIEEGLVRHGVGKVIPPADIVEQRARQIIGLQMVRREAAELDAKARENAAAAELPANLEPFCVNRSREFALSGFL